MFGMIVARTSPADLISSKPLIPSFPVTTTSSVLVPSTLKSALIPTIELQPLTRLTPSSGTRSAKMAYNTEAEEEHMLTYTPTKSTTPSAQHTQNLPTPPQPSAVENTSFAPETSFNYIKTTWYECRPWNEFYSTRHISIPKFPSLSDRFATNLHLYRANYQVVAAFWLGFVLLGFIPNLLIGAALFFLLHRWCVRRASKTNNALQHRDQVVAVLVSLTILWLTGLGMFALASLAFTAVSIALHASLHEPNHVETEIATV